MRKRDSSKIGTESIARVAEDILRATLLGWLGASIPTAMWAGIQDPTGEQAALVGGGVWALLRLTSPASRATPCFQQPFTRCSRTSWRRNGPVLPAIHRLAMLAGYALALLIAWSRVQIHVHSWSEVIAGFGLGAAASGWAIARMGQVPARPRFLSLRWAVLGLLGWLTVMPLQAAPSRSHDLVTRLALTLAAHAHPFHRGDLHQKLVSL